jgi:hypothetical protein
MIMMISQVSNFGYYPREASYPAPAPTGTEAQDPTALAPAPTGADSFSTASNLAPTAPEKKGTPWGMIGGIAAGTLAIGYGVTALSQGRWNIFAKAVAEGGQTVAKELTEQGQKHLDELVKSSHFDAKQLEGLTDDQIKALKADFDAGKSEAALNKVLDGFKKTTNTAGEAGAKSKTTSTVAKTLEGIDPETSTAYEINTALKRHNFELETQKGETKFQLESDFAEHEAKIRKQNRFFDLSKHSEIKHGTGLPKNHEVEGASEELVEELTKASKNGNTIEKANADYQLKNGTYKLVGFNDTHQPIYEFEPKALYSEAEKQVLELHYAGRKNVAEEVAKANGITGYTATAKQFQSGSKTFALPEANAQGYEDLVDKDYAFAFDEHGIRMSKTDVKAYIAECAKDKKAPELELIGQPFVDDKTVLRAQVIVKTGVEKGSTNRRLS